MVTSNKEAAQEMSDGIVIERVREYSPQLAAGIGRLMPHLDGSFSEQPTSPEHLEDIIASPYHDQLVAVRHHIEVVGATTLSVVMGAGFGRRGHMEDVVVDPESRGLGVGRKLLRETETWCREHGLSFILFDTEEHREAAIRLYEKWGAKRVTDGQNNKNGIVYRKDFDFSGEKR